jgi:hypothetical protein
MVERLNDMTPSGMLLDVSVSPREKRDTPQILIPIKFGSCHIRLLLHIRIKIIHLIV